MRRLVPLAAVALGSGGAAIPAAAPPLYGDYAANTLICLNTVTQATCDVWMGSVWKPGDDRYLVVWDNGAQAEAPKPDGPYRIEGREGRFTAANGRICIKPDPASRRPSQAGARGEWLTTPGCFDLADHHPGESWSITDAQGRLVRFWLIAGR